MMGEANVQLSDDVVTREVGGETMLLDLASGKYFGLNRVGGRFWQLLEDGQSAVQARDALLDEFEVAPEQLDRDLAELIGQLAAAGLVTVD
jgi:Coenzyme PQQ synthesis protein D (PqqD)